MSTLPAHRTRLVCTIGPASEPPEVLERMVRAGMGVARLNFSHGDFDGHARTIERIRAASRKVGRRVAILADLPGPKMRIGDFAQEPVQLERGATFVLTTRKVKGDSRRVSITLEELPRAVKPGDRLYLNDGLVELRVEKVEGEEIHCTVITGGELRSRKGLNVPGVELGSSAFTPRDRECMEFALAHGVDAVSQSFVSSAGDLEDLRRAAREAGHDPFVIAKIERSQVLEIIDDIIAAADGIMVARGDLGVEMPIERIAIAQKYITRRANIQGRPVITATQMLESMTHNRRPTRAEATDVANAILDGSDAVMLSEESAMGDYPVESVEMLARIAAATEPYIHRGQFMQPYLSGEDERPVDVLASSIDEIVQKLEVSAVLAPTDSGTTARSVTRYRLPCWILAPSTSEKTCRELMFSWGVWPIHRRDKPEQWSAPAREYLDEFGIRGHSVLVVEGPSRAHPDANHRLELLDLAPRHPG